MSNHSVIITGPQACGKTRNAAKLMKYFGLTSSRDWNQRDPVPPFGVLLLTNELSTDEPYIEGARVIAFADAIKAAG